MISKPTVHILVIDKADTNLDFFCECMINSDYVCIKHPDRNKKRKNCMNFIIPYKLDRIDLNVIYILEKTMFQIQRFYLLSTYVRTKRLPINIWN